MGHMLVWPNDEDGTEVSESSKQKPYIYNDKSRYTDNIRKVKVRTKEKE